MEPVVTLRQLLEAGVHFGHQTRRWNPKMKRFIYGERSGIYIIDLEQTLASIERSYSFIRDVVAGGGNVLFVGTKKQAQEAIRSNAEKCGMPYVCERWLGGMLTNFETISKRVGKMQEYQRMRDSGQFDVMPKKEALQLGRELVKLERNLTGIAGLQKAPDTVFILDTNKEHIAVTEARKLDIPIVAVVDTNCDPDLVDYVIPGNDDAIRAGALMARIVADAVLEGRFIASRRDGGSAGPPEVDRTAEEEGEDAAAQAEARREAAAAASEREARVAATAEPPAPGSVTAEPDAGEPAAAAAAEPPAPEPPAPEAVPAGPETAEPAAAAAAEPPAPGSVTAEPETAEPAAAAAAEPPAPEPPAPEAVPAGPETAEPAAGTVVADAPPEDPAGA